MRGTTPRRIRMFAYGILTASYAIAWVITLALLHPDLGDAARRWREPEPDDDDDLPPDVLSALKRVNVSRTFRGHA